MEKRFLGLAIFIIGILLGSAILVSALTSGENAQVAPGSVVVFVYDEKGNPIENATITLENNNSQIIKTGYTDNEGKMVFSGLDNFTGIIKISKDGYKTIQENITYNSTSTSGYLYIFHMQKSTNKYIDKAKNIYEEHKTAVIVGGAVILLLLLLMAFGSGKRIKW